MAPEIYMRQQHTDKVDVWAIGVLLFELTQRKVPFPQSDLDSIRKTVERKKIRFSKNTKPEVIDFIYQTLELNPQIISIQYLFVCLASIFYPLERFTVLRSRKEILTTNET